MFKVGETVKSELMNVIGVVVQENTNGVYGIKDMKGYVWHLDEKAELKKATAEEIKNMIENKTLKLSLANKHVMGNDIEKGGE